MCRMKKVGYFILLKKKTEFIGLNFIPFLNTGIPHI